MAEPPAASARDQVRRLRRLLQRSRRYLWAGALVVFLGGAISLVVALVKQRTYLSEAVVLRRPGIRSQVLGGTSSDGLSAGARLREMVMARKHLTGLIKELKLYRDVVEERGYVEAVDVMRRHIIFKARGDGTYHIAYLGETPELAQKVTQRLADMLVERGRRVRTEEARQTRAFLEAQQARAEKDLAEAERKVAAFLAKHPEFAQVVVMPGNNGPVLANPGVTAGASIRAARRKAELERQAGGDPALLALLRQAQRLRRRIADLKRPIAARTSATLRKLKEAVARAERDVREAQRNLARMRQQYTEKHPDVRLARRQLAAAESRLERARWEVVRQRSAKAIVPRASVADLEKTLSRVEREIASYRARKRKGRRKGKKAAEPETMAGRLVGLETTWTRLNRRMNDARARKAHLETQLFKVSLAASSDLATRGGELEIVDPAYLPVKPAGLSRRIILGGGLGLSMLVASVVVLLLGSLDDRIYDPEDIARLGLADVLVTIPKDDAALRRRRRRGRRG